MVFTSSLDGAPNACRGNTSHPATSPRWAFRRRGAFSERRKHAAVAIATRPREDAVEHHCALPHAEGRDRTVGSWRDRHRTVSAVASPFVRALSCRSLIFAARFIIQRACQGRRQTLVAMDRAARSPSIHESGRERAAARALARSESAIACAVNLAVRPAVAQFALVPHGAVGAVAYRRRLTADIGVRLASGDPSSLVKRVLSPRCADCCRCAAGVRSYRRRARAASESWAYPSGSRDCYSGLLTAGPGRGAAALVPALRAPVSIRSSRSANRSLPLGRRSFFSPARSDGEPFLLLLQRAGREPLNAQCGL